MTPPASQPDPQRLDGAVRTLASLGFTELESTVYAALVSGEGDTGYALAKATNKPVANVYKAIESLEAKGAIVVAGVEPRTLRAIDPSELIAGLRTKFDTRASDAEEALSQLGRMTDEEGLFRLRSADQVFDRAVAMIRDAEFSVLVDAFPSTLGPIVSELTEASRRGVRVILLTYNDEHDTPGVQRLEHRFGHMVLERRIGDHLILCADAQQLLMSQLEIGAKSVSQAIWTDSLFLAMHFYDSFLCQFLVHRIDAHVERYNGPKSVMDLFDELMDARLGRTPGFARYYGEAYRSVIPEKYPRPERDPKRKTERSK